MMLWNKVDIIPPSYALKLQKKKTKSIDNKIKNRSFTYKYPFIYIKK